MNTVQMTVDTECLPVFCALTTLHAPRSIPRACDTRGGTEYDRVSIGEMWRLPWEHDILYIEITYHRMHNMHNVPTVHGTSRVIALVYYIQSIIPGARPYQVQNQAKVQTAVSARSRRRRRTFSPTSRVFRPPVPRFAGISPSMPRLLLRQLRYYGE